VQLTYLLELSIHGRKIFSFACSLYVLCHYYTKGVRLYLELAVPFVTTDHELEQIVPKIHEAANVMYHCCIDSLKLPSIKV